MIPLTEDAQGRLDANLRCVRDGCETDLTSPLISSQYDDCRDVGRAVVSETVWRECRLSQAPLWLREKEAEQRGKIGSYSKTYGYSVRHPVTGTALSDSVERYYRPHVWDVRGSEWKSAIAWLRSIVVPPRRLVPWSVEQAAESFEGRTGFGFPIMSSNPKYYNTVFGESKEILSRLDGEVLKYYAMVIGTRSVPTSLNQRAKSRAIFQCPRVIGNLEKMIQGPLLLYLRDFPMFSAWGGRQAVDVAMTSMFQSSDLPIISLDFVNFDATVPQGATFAVFSVLRDAFSKPTGELIEFLWNAFSSLGLYTPNDYYLPGTRDGGIPSGSVLTNLVGSLVNLLVMRYAITVVGGRFGHAHVQGDDGVYCTDADPEELSEVLLKDLGMTMSVEKGYYDTDEVHFLQMVHRRSYCNMGLNVGVRPIMRVLNGMMSYERFKSGWSGYLDTLRWIQQLDNAAYHPAFEALCQWFLERDRYATLDVEGLIDRAGGLQRVEAALGGGFATSVKTVPKRLSYSLAARMLRYLSR